MSARSPELQVGQAAEHLVAADLLLRGFPAFLADQGAPYDIIVDASGRLVRVQVKGTLGPVSPPSLAVKMAYTGPVYRFSVRRAKGHSRRISSGDTDVIAFVALDRRVVAYLTIAEFSRNGLMLGTADFKTRGATYPGRTYSNGAVRVNTGGRFLEDFSDFARCL